MLNELHVGSDTRLSVLYYSDPCFQELRRSDPINQVRGYHPTSILHPRKLFLLLLNCAKLMFVFTDSWVQTLAVFLCPSRPSDPRYSASWLTHALSLFLPSPAAIGVLFLAPSTHCRLLLLCRFLVSARACLSRTFVSSRLTATFCSSSSLSRHFRVRLLV